MELISLDGIEYDNVEDVPIVKDSVIGTPIFDPTTEKFVTQEIVKTVPNDI